MKPRYSGRVGAAGGPIRRVALTRWFAIAGALAISAFSISMALLLARFIETRMLERDAALSRDFIQSIADTQRIGAWFRNPQGRPEPEVTEFFAHVAAMPDVIRANVYSRQRQVLWSSRAELIGKTFPANDELDEALGGEVVVSHGDEDPAGAKAEHQGLRDAGGSYVENYLPLRGERGGEVIGVIEVYRAPVALYRAIRSGQRLVWVGSAAGALFLFAVLVWFVRRAERALAEQQERLVDAEALGIVGEIAAAVAHSIRNPLVSIRSSAELQREIAGDSEGVYTEMIRNVDRIEQLVRTLLTYASDPSERQTNADLAAVLREAAERFAHSLRAGGKTFETSFGEDLGIVATDPVVLAQVFNSLLANAEEATQGGDRVSLRAHREGSSTRVEVEDSGTGIDPGPLGAVFKPFFTTKPRGMGLGLALVRRIVTRLGGDVLIDSSPGQGTRVSLRLPRHR